jgi:hypothetical protein
MASEEARRRVDALSKEELLLEINRGQRWSKVAIIIAIIAPSLGWLLNAIWPNPFGWAPEGTSSSWRPLVRGPTGLSTEVVTADFPGPNVHNIAGRFKFVDNPDQGAGHTVRFGYKIQVDVGPLDLSKVPKTFLEEKQINLGGGRSITQLPLTQSTATDEVRFEFLLKDRDGFTLMKLRGEPETLWTGKSNIFQRLLAEPVPENVAHRTTTVVESMSVDKCFPCEGG